MFVALLSLLPNTVQLGSTTGVSDAYPRDAASQVERLVNLAGVDMHIRPKIAGGITRAVP